MQVACRVDEPLQVPQDRAQRSVMRDGVLGYG
jgi:hypothetical protein